MGGALRLRERHRNKSSFEESEFSNVRYWKFVFSFDVGRFVEIEEGFWLWSLCA